MSQFRSRLALALVVSLLSMAPGASLAEERQLNIYNWTSYIGKNTISEFEAETGITVAYDTFESDGALEAKMMAGGAAYDVVSTSENYFGRQIRAGVYRALDRSLLPNWKNLDPAVLERQALFDPGNAHAMPYMQGVTGFTYDVGAIRQRMPDAPVDSLAMLFDPQVVSRFKDCGVTLLDQPEDVIQAALVYLHLDPHSTRPEDFKAAEALLLSIRPDIRYFDSVQQNIINREVCLVMQTSADFALEKTQARAAHLDIELAFTIPKEGAGIWSDAFLIPKGALHVENAHKFLNFLMEPRVIAAITNELHYANDNLAARPFVDPEILNDPAIYITPDTLPRLYLTQVDPSMAVARLRTRAWTRIKTGL